MSVVIASARVQQHRLETLLLIVQDHECVINVLRCYQIRPRYLPRSAPSGNISNACFSGLDHGRLVDPIRYDHCPERKVLQCALHLTYFTYEKHNCIPNTQHEYHCHPPLYPQRRTIDSPLSTNASQEPCNSLWPSIFGLNMQINCRCRDDR